MSEVISTEQAYEMYLRSGLEETMPFDSSYEPNYLEWLADRGYIVINMEDLPF